MEQDAIRDALRDPGFLETIARQGHTQRGLYVQAHERPIRPEDGLNLGANLWLAPAFLEDVANTPAKVAGLFAESIARDLDELRLHGDRESEDPFLALFDGSAKRGKPVRIGLVRVETLEMKIEAMGRHKDKGLKIDLLLRVVV